jgi:hypothetical protein
VNPSLSPLITSWTWIIIAAAGIIGAVVLTFSDEGRGIDGWWPVAIILGIAASGSDLLTLALSAAGWSSVALIVWRVTAIIPPLLGVALFLRNPPISFGPPGISPTISTARRAALIGTILLIGHALLAFQPYSLPETGSVITKSTAAAATFQTPHNILSIFWIGALVLLGLGALIFLILFVERVQRGGAPKIETHWGGIGGGLGGWRMSSSLGYLIVAIILSACFSMLLIKLDEKETNRERELSGQKVGDGVLSAGPTTKPQAPPAGGAGTPTPSPPGNGTQARPQH